VPAKCPNCRASIPLLQIGGEFSCSNCQSSLTARYSVALVAVIALWIAGDFAVAALCKALSPALTGWYAVTRVVGSAALAFVLYTICFPAWTRIEFRGAGAAARATSRRWLAAVLGFAWLCGGFFVFLFLVFGSAAAGQVHWSLVVAALAYVALAVWSTTRVLEGSHNARNESTYHHES
jgi:hypothetical protein